MTGYQSKKAAAQAIDKVNWADHEPDGLAQPAQEPVACKPLCELCVKRGYAFCANAVKTTPIPTPSHLKEQNFCSRCGKRTNDIHTCTPPQRTWVGLTDEEIDSVSLDYSLPYSTRSFARAIEAASKEKNND